MLTQRQDVEIHALGRGAGSSPRSAVTSTATGERPRPTWRDGSPAPASPRPPDPLDAFVPYLAARFGDDPHVWATALFDEVVPSATTGPT